MRLLLDIVILSTIIVEALSQDVLSLLYDVTSLTKDEMDLLIKGRSNDDKTEGFLINLLLNNNTMLNQKPLHFQEQFNFVTKLEQEFLIKLVNTGERVMFNKTQNDIAWARLAKEYRRMLAPYCWAIRRVFDDLNRLGDCTTESFFYPLTNHALLDSFYDKVHLIGIESDDLAMYFLQKAFKILIALKDYGDLQDSVEKAIRILSNSTLGSYHRYMNTVGVLNAWFRNADTDKLSETSNSDVLDIVLTNIVDSLRAIIVEIKKLNNNDEKIISKLKGPYKVLKTSEKTTKMLVPAINATTGELLKLLPLP